jgi:hypothetical protein
MAYTDGNTAEFNSLTSIHRPVLDYSGCTAIKVNTFSLGQIFYNSNRYQINNRSTNRSLGALLDKDYINYLNKIEKEYQHIEYKEFSLEEVKNKFSTIYSDLVKFKFAKMSVELTYDNVLIFSLNKFNKKYIVQYFIDFDSDDEDDIELLFSNISTDSNVSTEINYSQLNKVLYDEFETFVLAY